MLLVVTTLALLLLPASPLHAGQAKVAEPMTDRAGVVRRVVPHAILASEAQGTDPEALRALRERDVYVAPRARPPLTARDEAELQRIAGEHAVAGTVVKLAVLDRPPAGFRALGEWVDSAHGALRLGSGILIAVALDAGDGTPSVSAQTDALDRGTIERLQDRNRGAFLAAGYPEGMRALAGDLTAAIAERQAAGRARARLFVAGVLTALAVAALTVVAMLAVSWGRNVARLRDLQASLYPLLRRLDDDLPYLAGTPAAEQASALQAEAADLYDAGTELAERLARGPRVRGGLPGAHWSELGRATRSFEQAKQRLTEASAILDRALRRSEMTGEGQKGG